MKIIHLLILLTLITVTKCFSQSRALTIDSNLNSINKTKLCTEFQYYHCIDKCTASFSSDTLKIEFDSFTGSTLDDLTVSIIAGNVQTAYRTVYKASAPNTRNEWIPVHQSVTISSDKFTIGKKIRGKIEVEFQEIYIDQHGERQETQIIKFSGPFVARIKS